MKTLAIIAQKGGAGKTTVALNLAIASVLAKRQTVLVDIDKQASAHKWSRLRKLDDPAIIKCQEPKLKMVVQSAEKAGADLLVIDTAPHSEKASLTAAQLADFILIPVQPSNLDLDAIADSVNIAKLAKKPAAFILNDCKATSNLTREAQEALETYEVPIAPITWGSRVAFISSLKYGQGVPEYEPKGKGAQEVQKLYNFIKKQMGN